MNLLILENNDYELWVKHPTDYVVDSWGVFMSIDDALAELRQEFNYKSELENDMFLDEYMTLEDINSHDFVDVNYYTHKCGERIVIIMYANY